MVRAISTSAATSPWSAMCLPTGLPNGTGAVGRRWGQGWTALWIRWPGWGVTCMGGAFFRLWGGVGRSALSERGGSRFAKWNGSSWSAVGLGVDNGVLALGVSFSNVGAGSANGIAKWDGSSWSAMGSGMNGYVLALAVSGSDLYAGACSSLQGGERAVTMANGKVAVGRR